MLFDLLLAEWHLPAPNLVVSLVGEEQPFAMKSWLRDVLRKGLVKVAQSTGEPPPSWQPEALTLHPTRHGQRSHPTQQPEVLTLWTIRRTFPESAHLSSAVPTGAAVPTYWTSASPSWAWPFLRAAPSTTRCPCSHIPGTKAPRCIQGGTPWGGSRASQL